MSAKIKSISAKSMTKRICAIAMLVAITAVLAIFFTFRIGSTIKIPMKFISVFVAGFYFGPLVSGLVCAVGDLLNVIIAPSGAWLPLLTLGEFIYGYILGICFFCKKHCEKTYIARVIICATLCFLLDMFFTTCILVKAGYFPGFSIGFEIRLVAGIAKIAVQIAILTVLRRAMPHLSKVVNKVLK